MDMQFRGIIFLHLTVTFGSHYSARINMKYLSLLLIISTLCVSAFAQKARSGAERNTRSSQRAAKPTPRPTPKPTIDPNIEKAEFDAAVAITIPSEKIAAIESFINKYPASIELGKAKLELALALAVAGEEQLNAGNSGEAAKYFVRSINTSPDPIENRLFESVYLKLPGALFFSGARSESFEVASLLEKRIGENPGRMVSLAVFYLSIENGTEAKRLAEIALRSDPDSSGAYLTIGMADRIDFDLSSSAAAFAKALELDPNSIQAKRSLAEIQRALGKPVEAEKLYAEILATTPNDQASKNGLILATFESGKVTEAESAFAKALDENPKNISLIAETAYWYASKGNGDKAVELGSKAIAVEPRFIWSHIALARGHILKNRPVEAEKALIAARQYGNFPTLEYEIAVSRLKAGFFLEAAEELEKNFRINEDGVSTWLGGRIQKTDKTFDELLAPERRSSILAAEGSHDPNDVKILTALFRLIELVKSDSKDEGQIVAAVDDFVAGDDAMRFHRQLFASSLLLDKNVAIDRALELAASVTGKADAGLSVANPAAAVLASELYETRKSAAIKNEFLLVPEVPRQTLSAILRGRIEDLSGQGLLLKGNFNDATIRLRRAISVLPEKSAWWRTSVWRLGDALAASGNDKEALDSYLQSYDPAKPDIVRYITIEGLYKKVHGNADGLEEKIGVTPLPPAQQVASATPTPVVAENTPTEPELKTEAPTTEIKKDTEGDKKPDEPLNEAVKSTTDPKPEEPANPEAAPVEIKKEEKPAEPDSKPEEIKKEGEQPQKPLFDPVVINVTEKKKEADDAAEINPDTKNETDKDVLAKPDEELKVSDNTSGVTGSTRPRVVVEKPLEAVACRIELSQQNISLINNGGSIGLLVGFLGETEDRTITTKSEDPTAIEIKLEREMTATGGRSFYIIRSISQQLGTYKIEFSNPVCGKKEASVIVR